MNRGILGIAFLLAACSGSGGDSPAASPTPQLQIFAGTWGPAASVDGTGSQANFFAVLDMAFDAEGNLLVLDGAVRKVSPTAQVSTLPTPAFPVFSVIAVDGSGQAYVGEWAFHICRLGQCFYSGSIHRLAPTGDTTLIRSVASLSLGSLVAANGDLIWPDLVGHTIRKLSAAGDLTTIAGIDDSMGSEDGPGKAARFRDPQGLARGTDGSLYVADTENHTIRRIDASGAVTTIAGLPGAAGSNDGVGSAARFRYPAGLAVDDAGNLYVADSGNCTVRKVSAAAVVTTVAGSAGACESFVGGALPGALHWPRRVAVRGSDLFIGMRNGIAVVHNRP
jgi:sugar lactone lactonase YvrE